LYQYTLSSSKISISNHIKGVLIVISMEIEGKTLILEMELYLVLNFYVTLKGSGSGSD
jgi:hypothetical protein